MNKLAGSPTSFGFSCPGDPTICAQLSLWRQLSIVKNDRDLFSFQVRLFTQIVLGIHEYPSKTLRAVRTSAAFRITGLELLRLASRSIVILPVGCSISISPCEDGAATPESCAAIVPGIAQAEATQTAPVTACAL